MLSYLRPSADEVWRTELEIKRSRFICLITRVTSEEEARAFIARVRADYPDARHHCSAYLFAVEQANPVERSSDDGEPSGTAGMPMLEQLKGSGMLDIAAVVVRYFGGIKLGAGGLVHAYSEAVGRTLPLVGQVTRSRRELYLIEAPHADAGRIEAELRNHQVTVRGVEYAAQATVTVAVAPGDQDRLAGLVASISKGAITPVWAGEAWVETR